MGVKEQMIRRWREMAERDRQILAIWRENNFRFQTNGVDTTDQDRANFERRILELEDLIVRVEAADD